MSAAAYHQKPPKADEMLPKLENRRSEAMTTAGRFGEYIDPIKVKNRTYTVTNGLKKAIAFIVDDENKREKLQVGAEVIWRMNSTFVHINPLAIFTLSAKIAL